MGWNSRLEIGQLLCGTWRNHAPGLPSLLFTLEDFSITAPTSEDEAPTVQLTTSASRALTNLRASGFDWEHLLRDYSERRDGGLETAFVLGMLGGQAWRQAGTEPDLGPLAELLKATQAIPPAHDLRRLADAVFAELRAVKDCWDAGLDAATVPTPLADLLLFEHLDAELKGLASELPAEARVSLVRATEFFRDSQHLAPLVGWAYLMVELLQHSPADAVVQFDLSDGAPESDHVSLQAYADKYWVAARRAMSATATYYGSIFAALTAATTDVGQAARYGKLQALLDAAGEPGVSTTVKGQRLEELISEMLALPGTNLPILEKRLKHSDEELDLVLRNELSGPFWQHFRSPILIVECKNWSAHVGVAELRVLESKIRDRPTLCSVGVFVSLNGFTGPFRDRLRELPALGLTVFPVDGTDIREILQKKTTLPEWLAEKGLRQVI